MSDDTPRIWVPASAGRTPAKVFDCRVCGGQHDEAGVGRCARNHMDELRSMRLKERMPVLDDDQWDSEIAAHMKKVGERMLKEGRLTVKPNERAGFS